MTSSLADRAVRQPRVDRLMEQARDQAVEDDRGQTPYPLFQPVTLRRGSLVLSVFSRDIAESGMGLLPDMPIGGEYTISVQDLAGGEYQFFAVVLWCRPCGQGCYLSGVRFDRGESAHPTT